MKLPVVVEGNFNQVSFIIRSTTGTRADVVGLKVFTA